MRATKKANPPRIGCCSGILIIIAIIWFLNALAAPNYERAKSKAWEAENQRAREAEKLRLKY
ncbi:hypothetical protein J7L05_10000 [bacterium]|nr:hypothetical protein [bacterium]